MIIKAMIKNTLMVVLDLFLTGEEFREWFGQQEIGATHSFLRKT